MPWLFPSGGEFLPQHVLGLPAVRMLSDGRHHWLWPLTPWHDGCSRGANSLAMNNLLNIIIAVLIIGWLVGYIGFGAAVGNLIHILIVLALIGIVYRLFSGRRSGI